MANTQSVIELVFQGTDKTGAAVQSALSNTSKFASNVQAATQPIADFTAGALKIEAALLASGAAITAFSVKVAGDFDTAFREISTLISAPVEDLDSFKAAILSYASSSTKPLEEVTQSIYNAISAGVDYADAIEAVAIAEQLSVAGKATLNDSLLVLVSSLNAYGLGMEDAQRFSDALFTTVKQGQTTLPELASSLASVTGLAATAGVDFEELLAAIATLTSTGTPTSQAVTQIQGAISAILKPTSQASTLAKELGIEFNAQRLQAVGLSGILGDVQAATGGNAEQMALLFGRVEALNGVLTLTGLGADKFAENLQAMASSAGSVEAAFAIMVQAAEVSSQKVKNALDGLFIAIGAPLLDEFSGVAEAIAAIFKAIGDSARTETGVGGLVQYIEGEFAGLQDTLETVARNLPAALGQADFSGFTDGIAAVSGSIDSLFGGVDLSTVDGLADAITAVGQAFNGLSQFSAGVIDSFKPLANAFFDVGSGLTDIDEAAFRSAGEMAGFVTQLNLLSGPAVTAAAALVALNQALGIAASVGGLTTALGAVGGAGLLGALGQLAALGAAGGAGFGIGTAVAGVIDEIVNATTDTDESLGTWIYSLVNGAEDIAKVEALIAPLPQTIRDVGGASSESGSALQEVSVTAARLNKSFESVKSSASSIIPIYDEATGKIIGYTDGISEAGDIMNYVYQSSLEMADGIDKISKAGSNLDIKEKLALIESQTSISVASIEADAKKIEAAFESINVGIESTGQLLSDLFGELNNADNFRDKFQIEDQIKLENERRTKELELQEKLTKATIDELKARQQMMKSGGALITVNGDGLQPHLEAFMWEILEAIQVRVNADGYEMLLGGP